MPRIYFHYYRNSGRTAYTVDGIKVKQQHAGNTLKLSLQSIYDIQRRKPAGSVSVYVNA